MSKTPISKQDISRYLKNFWLFIIGCIALFALFLLSISLGLFGKMPSFRDLENPKSNIASEVISADGNVIGTYYLENRSFVKYSELSPNIVNALISTEDTRFYDHSGIDFSRTFTIVFYNLIGKRQGASTITQQLAKKLFGRENNIVVTKMKEWLTAIKLERNYTKQEILAMYLNIVDFGSNAYGIKTAARTFFDTTPDKLTVDQAALLIGILKGPSYYSPIRNPERAKARRNTVLMRMRSEGTITEEQFEEAKDAPIKLNYHPEDHNAGIAAYLREYLRIDISKMLEDGTIKPKQDGSTYDLYRDGLKIYTTIDSRMQEYAEQAEREHLTDLQKQFYKHWKDRKQEPWYEVPEVIAQAMRRTDRYRELKEMGKSEEEIKKDFRTKVKMTLFSWQGDIDTMMSPLDSIKYYKKYLRSAMMSMEPKTGYIRAWVGGNDFKYFKYDQVKVGARQVGSTFKPFVYTAAIDNGFSPCQSVANEPVSFENEDGTFYTPKNADGKVGGYYTLKQGLAQSKNLITMFLMKQIGPKIVAKYAHDMGITSEVPPYPSIGLGVADVTLYDMVGAYSTFANKGIWRKPIYLLRIEDKNGNVIYENKQEVKLAISEQTAYVMLDMLKGTSTLPGGTALRLRGSKYRFTNPIGAKTGTTQNQSDGWFMGVTPDLVTGVWTGCEDRGVHFHSLNLGEGANTALPAFALYMQRVYKDPALMKKYSKGDFARPDTINIELDCSKYATPPAETTEEGDDAKKEDRLDF